MIPYKIRIDFKVCISAAVAVAFLLSLAPFYYAYNHVYTLDLATQVSKDKLVSQRIRKNILEHGGDSDVTVSTPTDSNNRPNNQHPPSSCDHLFGLESRRVEERRLQLDGRVFTRTCIVHDSLGVSACILGRVKIDLSKISGAYGNESVAEVLGRSEHEEQLTYHKGALLLLDRKGDASKEAAVSEGLGLVGQKGFRYKEIFKAAAWESDNILNSLPVSQSTSKEINMFSRLRTSLRGNPSNDSNVCDEEAITYFVTRLDYALLPKVVSTLYDVWSTHQILTASAAKVKVCPPTIVWMDGYAHGGFTDHVYHDLFGAGAHLRHLGRLQGQADHASLTFRKAVFIDTTSPFWAGLALFNYKYPCQPNSGLHQFRDFVLQRFGVERKIIGNEPNRKKTLTFLVRTNYQPHPRSNGRTDRQIEDIDADAEYLRRQYPDYHVVVASFEKISFVEQLRVVAQTDFLVAVHGAGNMHIIFLPDNSKFLEYVPQGFEQRTRFKFISRCLNIKYESKRAVVTQKFNDRKISVSIQTD